MFRKITFKITLAIIALMVALPLVPAAAQDTPDALTARTTHMVKVRTGPSIFYPFNNTYLPISKEVTLEGRDAETTWALIEAGRINGWVSTQYLAPAPGVDLFALPVVGTDAPTPQLATVTIQANLRSRAIIADDNIVGTLPRWSTVGIEHYSDSGEWAFVHSEAGDAGWVAVDLLDFSPDAGPPVPAAEPTEEVAPEAGPCEPCEPVLPDESAAAPAGVEAAVTTVNSRLRNGPSETSAYLTTLSRGTTVIVRSYSADGWWAQIETLDGAYQGWLAVALLEPTTLPETSAAPGGAQGAQAAQGGESAGQLVVNVETTIPTYVDLVPGTPNIPSGWVLSESVVQNAREIYLRGRDLGNNADVLIKVGDSTSAYNAFLCDFQNGTYNLGGYGHLESVVRFFRQSGSLCDGSLTALPGYTTTTVIDAMWANPSYCLGGESSLACEYRLKKPSVAIIYIGLADMAYSKPDIYRANLNYIISYLTENGVIPVLNTVTSSDLITEAQGVSDRPPAFNAIVRDVAGQYQVPLIDFDQLAQTLPNQGCIDEGYHLSYRTEGWVDFNGDEKIFGKNLRELVTLQMLNELRQRAFY